MYLFCLVASGGGRSAMYVRDPGYRRNGKSSGVEKKWENIYINKKWKLEVYLVTDTNRYMYLIYTCERPPVLSCLSKTLRQVSSRCLNIP